MKTILYVHDLHFYESNGFVYTSSNFPELYFYRFLEAGDVNLKIYSRIVKVENEDQIPEGYERIKNQRIMVVNECGSTYLKTFFRAVACYRAIKSSDMIVANIPSILGVFVLLINLNSKLRYCVEVAADHDQFSSKRGGFLVSFFMRYFMKYFIRRAQGAAYVANHLKEKFPCNRRTIISSNVNINEVVSGPYIEPEGRDINISFVGGLNERKGLNTLIESISFIKNNTNYNIKLNVIGGHADRNWDSIIRHKNLENNIILHGLLSTKEVINILDRSDLYVQPSITEGIPRATIEAMSRGLPVVATSIPGFQEILDKDVLVKPQDSSELARKIIKMLVNKNELRLNSTRNKLKAKMFLYENLHKIRTEHYKNIFMELF
ncbi:TPA: glycosyltransferase [Vibrio vulnificus]|nr:glycosyltransferase [Vibrio vulnificus]